MTKLKSLKKNVKQYLFNFSISKNLFMIFEIRTNIIPDVEIKFTMTESFSKQIFNKLKYKGFEKIKFPNRVRSLVSLKNLIEYFLNLKVKKNLASIILIKIYFFLLKKNISLLTNIFLTTKNLLIFNSLLFVLIKKKILLSSSHISSYPFIRI